MAKADKKTLSMQECVDVAERMSRGFDEAVGDTKGELAPMTRMLVGMRGALGAVRDETNAEWIVRTLGRALAQLGVTEEANE